MQKTGALRCRSRALCTKTRRQSAPFESAALFICNSNSLVESLIDNVKRVLRARVEVPYVNQIEFEDLMKRNVPIHIFYRECAKNEFKYLGMLSTIRTEVDEGVSSFVLRVLAFKLVQCQKRGNCSYRGAVHLITDTREMQTTDFDKPLLRLQKQYTK
jgi:hypothetical protein